VETLPVEQGMAVVETAEVEVEEWVGDVRV
jgi:hypothetical protein